MGRPISFKSPSEHIFWNETKVQVFSNIGNGTSLKEIMRGIGMIQMQGKLKEINMNLPLLWPWPWPFLFVIVASRANFLTENPTGLQKLSDF